MCSGSKCADFFAPILRISAFEKGIVGSIRAKKHFFDSASDFIDFAADLSADLSWRVGP